MHHGIGRLRTLRAVDKPNRVEVLQPPVPGATDPVPRRHHGDPHDVHPLTGLLPDLAVESGLRQLAEIETAAGETPRTRRVGPSRVLGQQHAALAAYDGV